MLLEVDVDDDEPGATPRSAQCPSLVEKGGQRTMRTYLGASLKMGASHFDENVERLAFGDDDAPGESNANTSKSKSDDDAAPGGRDRASLLHVEGYTLYRPDLARAAMTAAKRRGALVSLDLASFEVVRNCRAQLRSLLDEGLVDLLLQRGRSRGVDRRDARPDAFAREDAGCAMEWMLRYVRVATVSLDARGCVSVDRDGSRASPGRSLRRRGHHRRGRFLHRGVPVGVPEGGSLRVPRRVRGGNRGGSGARGAQACDGGVAGRPGDGAAPRSGTRG